MVFLAVVGVLMLPLFVMVALDVRRDRRRGGSEKITERLRTEAAARDRAAASVRSHRASYARGL
ncbi:hypothetical protein [Streptomyces sp. JJ36]|uniref:hypothetical protein n=1 Tax=Streptomyces sp. JJ36 TaxID=2736645 RepID=UPI001F3067EF|nr:hypothetical protein [Streptomyces sp. JJ36]MCF6523085.1 hypothetical protein [Streptomyces sp. JJ36]